jgi:nucleotide-binding universal stress UspA family protein
VDVVETVGTSRFQRITLVSVQDADSPTGRGKLRTYLGIAPGVGKTYAMLRDARARRRVGVDTVVAHWERHGRPETAAQLDDLEVIPARTVAYRNASFAELDVRAVLARRPQLAVVDELAHANVPGDRHAKRWQDIEELLANGIDVYTTLNVGNIESLGQAVARITGVRPAEPVPDAFVRSGEVKLVDLGPAALRHRLGQGLVVPGEQVDAALSNYFRFANLAALRELARLWLDDSVPDPVTAYAAAHGLREMVQASVIVVGLQGSPADEWLIRYAANLAGLSDARLQAVHVRALDNLDPATERLEKDRRLLGELGGTLLEVRAGDPASGLLEAAREAGACQLVIGSRHRWRLSRLLNGSTVTEQVLRAAGDLPVQVVNVGRPDKTSREWRRQPISPGSTPGPEASRNRPQADPADPAHTIALPASVGPLASQPGDIPVGGTAYGGGAVVHDHPPPPAAVHPVEGESLGPAGDVEHSSFIEWNEVWVAPHEAHPVAVGDHSDGVAGEQRAAALRPGRPVQDCRAIEVAADPGERQPRHWLRLVIEQLDARRGPLNPLLVCARDQDASAEGVGEFDIGGVEMRVRHADGANPAELGDPSPGGLVQQRGAVPQHVALRGAHQQSPLTDGEGRVHPDAEKPWLLLTDDHGMIAGQVGHSGPALAATADILALVSADGARIRRPRRVSLLNAAGNADPRRH